MRRWLYGATAAWPPAPPGGGARPGHVLACRNLAADGIDVLPDFSRTSEGEGLMEGHTGQMLMREIVEDYLTT